MKKRKTHILLAAVVAAGLWACGGGERRSECVYPLGSLRLDADQLLFDTVALGSVSSQTLRVHNPTAEAVLLEQSGRTDGFSIYYEGEEMGFGGVRIPPGDVGELRVDFRPVRDTLLGNYFDRLRFFVDGEGGFSEGIYVKAYVRDDFAATDSSALPRLVAEERIRDFGPVAEGDTVKAEFRLRNAGSHDLLIRKVEASCGCTVVEMDGRILPPGGGTTVRVTLDTRGLSGFQRKRVTLYTNDPASPAVVFTLRGDVIKKGMLE